MCARRGALWLVKVQGTPGKGKCSPDSEGVHREVESEGGRGQNAGLTNRNRIEAAMMGEKANPAAGGAGPITSC